MYIFELSDILPPGASPCLSTGTADSAEWHILVLGGSERIIVYSGNSKW